MIKHPKTRQWGLVGTAGSGKSSFIGSNVRTPALIVDADNRFDAIEARVGGELIYASRAARANPLKLLDELDEHGYEVESIVFDSISPMYSIYSRRASMRGNMSAAQRKEAGLNANKASDMVAKADMMNVIGNSTIYGADVYFVWHRDLGLDVGKMSAGEYKDLMQPKDSISQVELDRLAKHMNMLLFFYVENGVYKIRVEDARDFGDIKANKGVVISDYPGNLWKNASRRIMDRVYVNFGGQQEAMAWAASVLGRPEESLIDLYDDVKTAAKPKSASVMWQAWVDRVHQLLFTAQQSPAPTPAPDGPSNKNQNKPSPPSPRPQAVDPGGPPPPPPPSEADAMFDSLVEPLVPERDGDHYSYADQSPVSPEHEEQFLSYCHRNGRLPFDEETFLKAVDFAANHGEPY